MSSISRRAFLKQAGLLVAVGLMPRWAVKLKPLAAGQAGNTSGWVDAFATSPTLPSDFTTQLQTPHHALMMDLSLADYVNRFNQLASQGYRMLWVQGVGNGSGAATFSSIWVRDGITNWYVFVNMDATEYQNKFNSYASQGYRPISVSGYQDSGSNRFGAIWLYDPGVDYVGIHNTDSTGYQNFFNNNAANGYRAQVVDGYAAGTVDNYIAIMYKTGSGGWVATHGLTSADYQSFFNNWASQGYRVIDVSAYQVGGTTYFAAIMVNDGAYASAARHDYLPSDLFNQAISFAQTDQQPIVIEAYDTGSTRNFAGVWIQKVRSWTTSGDAVPSLAAFDATMQSFMQARNIPSGTLAVTKDSRLVLARGYRWDYDSVDPVQPDSLFRIASLTKPLTASAVMRLVQEGHLNLSDHLTSLLSLTPTPVDSRMNNITVLHLLQHLGGWNRDTSNFDPMFADQTIATALGSSLPISQQNIISYMNGRLLDFTPGTLYDYSNYGYLLLGRIIEAVTGMSYSAYMQKYVFDALNINRIKLGSSLFEQRQTSEVAYYTSDPHLYPNVRQPGGPANAMLPYGNFNIENMDSHGGWLASAVDMARFMTAFDSTGGYPLLNPATISQIFAIPATGIQPDGSWYGCGWAARYAGSGLNTWHNGSLPGTTTLMVRRFDGLNWAVLFNQRDDPSGLSYGDIDNELHTAANSVSSWPTGDLFPSYGLPTPFRYRTFLAVVEK
jgi:CubicO group peptidase (beta-lactamase class C family)